jgi:hypothetical protein
MSTRHATAHPAALWNRGRSPELVPPRATRMPTGIEAVFPVVHTPYYVYERIK